MGVAVTCRAVVVTETIEVLNMNYMLMIDWKLIRESPACIVGPFPPALASGAVIVMGELV
jgi:hypothetical protein